MGLSPARIEANVVVGGVRPGIVEAEYTDFTPRVGFAFQLNRRTVPRGGYGIFYAMNNDNNLFFVEVNPGVKIARTYQEFRGAMASGPNFWIPICSIGGGRHRAQPRTVPVRLRDTHPRRRDG